MDKEGFNKILDQLAYGWTTRNYGLVASHFSDTLFYSDPLNYTIRSNHELLEFFNDDEGKPQKCVFHNAIFDEAKQSGVAEYTYEGRFIYHGTVWIEFKQDKIVSWREYQHKSEKNWVDFWELNERDRS